MPRSDFFKQLKENLHHPLRDRFLEELKDHVQDMRVENLNGEELEKRMGEPKFIKKIFLQIMTPFGKTIFIFKGLLFGVLIAITAFINFPAFAEFIFSFFGQIGNHLTETLFKPQLWINLLLLILLYFWAFKSHEDVGMKYNYGWWVFLIILPSLLYLGFFGIDILNTNINFVFSPFYTYASRIPLATALLFFSFLNGIIAGLFFFLNKRKFKNIKEDKIKLDFQVQLKKWHHILFGYTLSFIIFRLIGTYVASDLFYQALTLIYFPFIILEKGLSIGWEWVFVRNSASEDTVISFAKAIVLPGSLFIFIGLYSFFSLMVKRKWISSQFLVFLYVTTTFLISSSAFENKIDFEVPAINVSKLIEKQSSQIFYKPLRYFNRNSDFLFQYKSAGGGIPGIELGDNNISSMQMGIGGENFSINLTVELPNAGRTWDINTGHFLDKTIPILGTRGTTTSPTGFAIQPSKITANLSKALRCSGKKYHFKANETFTCNNFSFQGNLITSTPLIITSFSFTADGKFMLLVVKNKNNETKEVHLLNLIKSKKVNKSIMNNGKKMNEVTKIISIPKKISLSLINTF